MGYALRSIECATCGGKLNIPLRPLLLQCACNTNDIDHGQREDMANRHGVPGNVQGENTDHSLYSA